MLSQKIMQHPVLVLIVFALLGVTGLFTLQNTEISLMPETENPYLSVFSTYANAGPDSVEKSVTTPIENALVSLTGLKSISSSSSEGSSNVFMEFEYGTDLDLALNDVREKLDRISRSLPSGVTPTIRKFSMSSQSIMQIAIRGNRTTDDLKQLAENYVVDTLEQVDGVGEASVMGGRTKIVRVELSQNRLAAYGLTLSSVSSSLSTQNIELGGGTVTEGKTNYSVRTVGEYKSIEEINNTVITTVNGYGVKIRDVGNAFIGFQDASSYVYINGEPGVYMSVTKQSGANSVTVANSVYKKIDEIKTSLPSDVTLEIIRDETESIRDTLNTLLESAWQGLLLAVIILFVFLCNFKSTIIISISIPLSIIITLLCMNLAGITLNMMTLTGLILGVGMIVDASIVMIDNIYSYRLRGAKPKVSAVLGSQEMLMSVLSGNLTTICVFVPFLFFMKDLGIMGQMFKGIIFTIVIALVSSLFVAIFLVPVLAGHFLPLTNRKEKPVKNPVLKAVYGFFNKGQSLIQKIYDKALRGALNHRAAAITLCITALIIAVLFATTLRIQIMPNGHSDSVTLSISTPIGTTLEETATVVNAFEDIVEKEIQGYTSVITSIGGGRGSSYSGSIQISLPESDKQIDTDQNIQKKLRAHFQEYADVTFSFGRGMRQMMSGDDIDIVIRSSSLDLAMEVANKVSNVIEANPNLGEPSIDTQEGLPQVEIEVNRARAYSFGVNVNTVATEIKACIEGTVATVYRNNGEDYSVYVMLKPEDRQKVIDLEQIYVRGSTGPIAVSNFASVKKGVGPVQIRHEDRRRIVHVQANLLRDDMDAKEAENQIREGIASSFIIPDGVTVSYEGAWQETTSQMNLYTKIILMAILLVFGVMAATYESFKAPIINLTTIPFLIIGVVFICKITGQPLSLLSAIGLIMLVGIVVNNGIILVDYTNLLVNRGLKIKDACFKAGSSRLRPVLMTTLTTVLGMLPMCFASSGTAAMVQPIGITVVGGLITSTFITLFFIPVLYSLIMKEKKNVKPSVVIEALEEKNEFTKEDF